MTIFGNKSAISTSSTASCAAFEYLNPSEVDITLRTECWIIRTDLLKELDFTAVCSIHSRFALDKKAQTDRLLRAMDNRYFNILGHATGRLLLKRPGYRD